MAPVRRPLKIRLGVWSGPRKNETVTDQPSTSKGLRRSLRGVKKTDVEERQEHLTYKNENWRTKMKRNNPKKYEQRKELERQYMKIRNLSLSDEQKEWERMLSRERQRKCRQKKKEQEVKEKAKGKSRPTSRTSKKQKEKKVKEQRKKWAEEKRNQRANWTSSKRKEVNMKARIKRIQDKEELQQWRKEKIAKEKELLMMVKMAEKEEEERRKTDQEENVIMQQETQVALEMSCLPRDVTSRSKEARRQSLSRARSSLSARPKIYAETVEDLVVHATPRKKRALENCSLYQGSKEDAANTDIAANVAESLKKTKLRRDKSSRISRKHLASTLPNTKMSTEQKKKFSTTSKYLGRLSNKGLQKDNYRNPFAMKPEDKEKVREFYEANSMQLPNKKDISKKTFKKTSVLQMPQSTLYQKFKSANPGVKVGISTFKILRPQHVKLMSKRKMVGCLCEYCTNLDLKLNALNKKIKGPIKNNIELTNLTLCTKPSSQEYHDPKCYKRECNQCGVKTLKNHLELLEESQYSDKIEWERWEMTQSPTGKRMQLTSKKGDLKDLIEEIMKEAHPHARHLHNWWWQHQNYSRLIKDPPANSVVAVLDFAENYACLTQNEVQSAHWYHNQATVHPIVTTYRCPSHNRIVSHSMVYISDDKKHDYHAVQGFFKHSIQNLSTKHGIELKKIYRFSDGCSAQYKSKGPFLDVANFNIPTEHHFFGSRHGKGPSDGESAVVKQYATVAVRNGTTVIPTAEAMFKFLEGVASKGEEVCASKEEQDCVPFRREVFFVSKDTIERERPLPKKAVKNTRLLHCIKSSTDHSNTISWRVLSCFCTGCMADGPCSNIQHTGPWNTVKLEVPTTIDPDGDLDSHPDQSSSKQTERNEETDIDEDVILKPVSQDFVTVQLAVQGKKKASDQFFVAQVATVEGDSLRLQYLKKVGDLFAWPAGEPQYFLHPVTDVVQILPCPELVMTGSRPFLKFP